MYSVHLLLCLLLPVLSVESYSASTRQQYGTKDSRNHLSNFYDGLNDIFSRNNTHNGLKNLLDLFLRSEFENRDDLSPIHFSGDSPYDPTQQDSEGGGGTSPGKRIAECVLTDESDLSSHSPKFYLPLKDAEVFAKNIEFMNTGRRSFNILNLGGNDAGDATGQPPKVSLKCTAVLAENVTDTCKACLYFEEMVLKRHFRYGQLLECGVMECMDGYDERLRDSSNKGYFVFDFVKYHPICVT